MRTRNRIALVNALNKMTLKDFKSEEERNNAYALLKQLDSADAEELTPKKRAGKREGAAKVALTAKPGEGIVRKTTEEATVSSKPASRPVEDELAL
jgi:hypothetical protein